eukprot:GSA25T00016155001.1
MDGRKSDSELMQVRVTAKSKTSSVLSKTSPSVDAEEHPEVAQLEAVSSSREHAKAHYLASPPIAEISEQKAIKFKKREALDQSTSPVAPQRLPSTTSMERPADATILVTSTETVLAGVTSSATPTQKTGSPGRAKKAVTPGAEAATSSTSLRPSPDRPLVVLEGLDYVPPPTSTLKAVGHADTFAHYDDLDETDYHLFDMQTKENGSAGFPYSKSTSKDSTISDMIVTHKRRGQEKAHIGSSSI